MTSLAGQAAARPSRRHHARDDAWPARCWCWRSSPGGSSRTAEAADRAHRGRAPAQCGSAATRRRPPASDVRTPARCSGRRAAPSFALLPRSEALRRRLDQAGLPLNPPTTWSCASWSGLGVALGASFRRRRAMDDLGGHRRDRSERRAPSAARASDQATQAPVSQPVSGRDRPDRARASARGLPVAEALQAAGQELPNQVGNLFREVTGNVKLGKTLDESLAWRRASSRCRNSSSS